MIKNVFDNVDKLIKHIKKLKKDFKLIINSSRSIIYASSNDDFAEKAALEAKKIQNEMESYINKL